MLSSVDPALLSALGLEPTSTKLLSYGGSGFSSTYKLVSTKEGHELQYFVKTGTGPDAEVMFRGEFASLNAIHNAVPSFCPKAYAHGPLHSASASSSSPQLGGGASAGGKYFLVTDFIDLASSASGGTGLSFAAKLATLHTTPAPIPKGHTKPIFGFPVSTCCGSTLQDNSYRETWADFYADCRLRAIVKECIKQNGADRELSDVVEKTACKVVPRLLGEGHLKDVIPVVVHGDLWSGNHGRGRIFTQKGSEEVVFDPSSCYAHSEYELGIMKMFGGFDAGGFWKEYHSLVPKSEPAEEYDDRVALYELYHHLNHFALFGGGYRGGAMSIMRKLLSKYG
ncbi:hypothetical protein QC763_603790 [Podospora pseudopauciseta]|uniref:protein-ribulosamine 3-kinase n=1 Tax=Podospora pseudopauciseta TaxID=2093780 RepID=A0ABR0H3L7_9PEZI|nr:hypothetical protein QC763_603790 [Podospora pseudopauciseta]